jgi:hypothetical protein
LKFKQWILLLSALALMGAGGAFLMKRVLVLQIVNTDRTQKLYLWVTPHSPFTLSYVHSIYLEPASEEFEVEEGESIVLKAVSTKSPAVAHYYGFEGGPAYYPVNRRMKTLALRLSMSSPQTLYYGNRKISLQEIGERGDRLEVRVVPMALVHYLLSPISLKKDGWRD